MQRASQDREVRDMNLGKVISLPNEFSRFARILDPSGVGYTVEPGEIPDDVDEGDDVAYRVEIWGGDSGLAYEIEED